MLFPSFSSTWPTLTPKANYFPQPLREVQLSNLVPTVPTTCPPWTSWLEPKQMLGSKGKSSTDDLIQFERTWEHPESKSYSLRPLHCFIVLSIAGETTLRRGSNTPTDAFLNELHQHLPHVQSRRNKTLAVGKHHRKPDFDQLWWVHDCGLGQSRTRDIHLLIHKALHPPIKASLTISIVGPSSGKVSPPPP